MIVPIVINESDDVLSVCDTIPDNEDFMYIHEPDFYEKFINITHKVSCGLRILAITCFLYKCAKNLYK